MFQTLQQLVGVVLLWMQGAEGCDHAFQCPRDVVLCFVDYHLAHPLKKVFRGPLYPPYQHTRGTQYMTDFVVIINTNCKTVP